MGESIPETSTTQEIPQTETTGDPGRSGELDQGVAPGEPGGTEVPEPVIEAASVEAAAGPDPAQLIQTVGPIAQGVHAPVGAPQGPNGEPLI